MFGVRSVAGVRDLPCDVSRVPGACGVGREAPADGQRGCERGQLGWGATVGEWDWRRGWFDSYCGLGGLRRLF